jgi:hypothetical protein
MSFSKIYEEPMGLLLIEILGIGSIWLGKHLRRAMKLVLSTIVIHIPRILASMSTSLPNNEVREEE